MQESYGVTTAEGANDSHGVTTAEGANDNGNGVTTAEGANDSYGVTTAEGANESYGVTTAEGANDSYGVTTAEGANDSHGVTTAEGANDNGSNNTCAETAHLPRSCSPHNGLHFPACTNILIDTYLPVHKCVCDEDGPVRHWGMPQSSGHSLLVAPPQLLHVQLLFYLQILPIPCQQYHPLPR